MPTIRIRKIAVSTRDMLLRSLPWLSSWPRPSAELRRVGDQLALVAREILVDEPLLERDILGVPELRVAMILPIRSWDVSMPSRTTSWAPPDVAPEINRSASPSDSVKPLIVGPGPMNPMSIEPPSSAPISSGPALNVVGGQLGLAASWKKPWFVPISAVACVTFPK